MKALIRAVSLERGIKHPVNIGVDEWGVMLLPAGAINAPVGLARDKWGKMRLPAEKKMSPSRPME